MTRKIFLSVFISSLFLSVAATISAYFLFFQNVHTDFSSIAVIIFSLILIGLSVLVGILVSFFITSPVKHLADKVHKSEVSDDTPYSDTYDELIPLVDEIRYQRIVIGNQLRELADEREKLEFIMRDMPVGILALDMAGHILMSNESGDKFLGITRLEESGLFTSSNIDAEKCINAAIIGEYNTVYTQYEGRDLQIMASPVLSDGRQSGVVCFAMDVTEKLQIDRIKQEFTANVTHELKTPLTSISGYAEMIETGIAKNDDICRFATIIRKEAARLLSLISDIIKLSELTESTPITSYQQVQLKECVEECVDILSLSAEKAQVSVNASYDDSTVYAERALICELIFNLMDNAIRYNKKGGTVTVTAKNDSVTVSDTGIGIPPEHHARIFERFYRVDKSRSKATGGTGLGLAIVKHVAELYGAKVTLSSAVGVGTTIRVDFSSTKNTKGATQNE